MELIRLVLETQASISLQSRVIVEAAVYLQMRVVIKTRPLTQPYSPTPNVSSQKAWGI